MKHFRSFEDMVVWQESRKIVRAIRTICKKEIVRRDFSFIDQITRAARSVSANIAEGSEAMTIPIFINYLGIAKCSAGEVRSHLYDSLDDGYISQEEFSRLTDLTKKICSMLAKLIHRLQSADSSMKRTYSQSKPYRINELTS